MPALSAADLLRVWEAARALDPVRRDLALLAAAWPEQDLDALAGLPIGRRDGLLLTLREQIFGPRLWSLAACPACGEQVELAFDVADIRAEGVAVGADGVAVADSTLRIRMPTSRDLLALADSGDLVAARSLLLRRCVLAESAPAVPLDPALEAAIVAEIARCDPQADIRLALQCPVCGHSWEALFDIGGFLWSELDRWAVRLLHEVHLLASAYGWREADILALSAVRRRAYLDLVSA